MKPSILTFCSLVLACAVLTGCSIDQHAKMLIEQNTTDGKMAVLLVGSSEQLIKDKKHTLISAAKQYTMPDGTRIDLWIYKAS
ncbi:MAG: hypothetical protein KAV00_00900, partial [Phycisphaerae bacterium]|nr:hypothetical protein [Phycisphaerae bacterium]